MNSGAALQVRSYVNGRSTFWATERALNDGTRIWNGDRTERAGSVRVARRATTNDRTAKDADATDLHGHGRIFGALISPPDHQKILIVDGEEICTIRRDRPREEQSGSFRENPVVSAFRR
jgi:hypothetical protein